MTTSSSTVLVNGSQTTIIDGYWPSVNKRVISMPSLSHLLVPRDTVNLCRVHGPIVNWPWDSWLHPTIRTFLSGVRVGTWVDEYLFGTVEDVFPLKSYVWPKRVTTAVLAVFLKARGNVETLSSSRT